MILASSSPRRKELLHKITDDFIVVAPNIDEGQLSFLPPFALPGEESKLKAYAVKSLYPHEEVLACDTVVLLHGKILGKPKDELEAFRMLKEESGQVQLVLSGYTYLGKGKEITRTIETKVYFKELSDELIWEYIREKKPLDKAGAYGIQDGYPLVDHIEGSYDNVVGLPTEDILLHIR